MSKIKGYANYGVLNHEKKILFTIGDVPTDCVVSERVEYTIPDDWEISENEFGTILLTAPWGCTYCGNDVITSKNDNPYLTAYDTNSKLFQIPLKWSKL